MSKKATDVVAYITWIGWFVAFFAGTKEESKFHINQALVLNLASLILSVLGYIPIVGIIAGIVSIVVFVFWIMALVSACQGTEKEVPLLGGIKILK